MGLDTNTKVNNIFIGTSKPKDIWVGTNLVKEMYVDKKRVYNSTVYVNFVTNSQCKYLYGGKLYYTVKLDGTTKKSGYITDSTYMTSTYAHPQSVNGTRLGYYGLDVGYGATIDWKIDGVISGYGAFDASGGSSSSKTKSVTYSGNKVNNVNNDLFYSNINAISAWDIRPVTEKEFSGVRPFTSSGTLDSSKFSEDGQAYVSLSFWPNENEERTSSDTWLYVNENYEQALGVPMGSKGYITIQLYGVKVCNIGTGKQIADRVNIWSEGYSAYAEGTSTSRTTADGYEYDCTVYLGYEVSKWDWSSSDFSSRLRDIRMDDYGNVYVDIALEIGYYTSNQVSEPDEGQGGCLYFGPGISGNYSLNGFLRNIVVGGSVYYG